MNFPMSHAIDSLLVHLFVFVGQPLREEDSQFHQIAGKEQPVPSGAFQQGNNQNGQRSRIIESFLQSLLVETVGKWTRHGR